MTTRSRWQSTSCVRPIRPWRAEVAQETDAYTHHYLSPYCEPDSLVAKVSGSTLYRQVFGRDALGRITTMTERLPDSSHSYDYEYDLRGRLTQVTKDGALIQQSGYDGNGNRTSFTGASAADTASATYDAQDRLLRSMDTRYEYSVAGELEKKIERHYDPLLTLGPEPFWEHDTTWYTYKDMLIEKQSLYDTRLDLRNNASRIMGNVPPIPSAGGMLPSHIPTPRSQRGP